MEQVVEKTEPKVELKKPEKKATVKDISILRMKELETKFMAQQKQREEQFKEGLKKIAEEQYKEQEELKKKPKLLRLPFKLPKSISKKVGKKNFRNHVLVIYLRRNREADMYFLPASNDMIKVNGMYYDARVDCYYTYGKQRVPTLVIPEYRLIPIGTEDYHKAVREGNTTDAQDISIKSFEKMEAEGTKTKMNSKTVIFIILGAVVVLYLLSTVLS